MGNLERRIERLEGLEQLTEARVVARVEEELEAAIHRLEQHLTREELRRVLEILDRTPQGIDHDGLEVVLPSADDPLGQAAYTAAALRGLAEALATLQGAAK